MSEYDGYDDRQACSDGCFVCSGSATGYHDGGCCHGGACNAPYSQRRAGISREDAAKIQLWLDMENVWRQEVRDWVAAERFWKNDQRVRQMAADAMNRWLAAEQDWIDGMSDEEFYTTFPEEADWLVEWLYAEKVWLDAQQAAMEAQRRALASPKVDRDAVRDKMAKARKANVTKVHVERKVKTPKTAAAAEMHRKLGVR